MKKLNIYIFVSLLFSCNNNNTEKRDSPELKMNNLKKEIVYNRNDESYGVFLDMSANDPLNYESLALSLTLADKGNPKANHMVFYYMIQIFDKNKFDLNNLNKLSEVNKNFALHYLKKAAKMNDFQSQVYLEEIYRKGIGLEINELKADSILSVLKEKDKTYKPLYELRKNQ